MVRTLTVAYGIWKNKWAHMTYEKKNPNRASFGRCYEKRQLTCRPDRHDLASCFTQLKTHSYKFANTYRIHIKKQVLAYS